MQKVKIRKTKSSLTILRKNSKIVVIETPLGFMELGEFPIDVDVKVVKVPFDPSLYGEDMLYQIKKVLAKRQVDGWIPATCGRTLLSAMTDQKLRVDNKYQLMAFARQTPVKGGSDE